MIIGATSVIGDCTYGVSQLTEGSRSTERGQFVDLDNPITCSGVLHSLTFCYYADNMNEDQSTFRVFFRIFRYEPVGDVLRQTHVLDRSFNVREDRRSFMCKNHYYSEEENVYVEPGDYIAVYIPSLSAPLPILGRNLPAMRVYGDTRSITTQFFSTTIPQSALVSMENKAIHVSADISKYRDKVAS